MQKTAARCAVMAGAEGEPRLDLDGDVVGADPGAIMGAMNEKARRAFEHVLTLIRPAHAGCGAQIH
jgi:hypothetical protein